MKFSQPKRGAIPRSLSFRANRPIRTGLNLIELVVIITVIGVTLILLMPVIQHTRETARRMLCYNNLKELSLACSEHLATLHHFPTGGWPGPNYWMGDPDLGYEKRQPGGWTYNILPFLENKPMHDWGMRKTPAQKKTVFGKVAMTALDVYYCPSRRMPTIYPIPRSSVWTPINMTSVPSGARTDYAANGRLDNGMGIIYAYSLTTIKDIRDGLSHTYLLGEKNVIADHYVDGTSFGDGLPAYGNSFWDWERTGNTPPARDRRGSDNYTAFGSAHPTGFNMSFCDGSASTISYQIEPVMHERLCDRNDGKVAVIP
jgi:prepilin-type processing-associated H-X9-DG protein